MTNFRQFRETVPGTEGTSEDSGIGGLAQPGDVAQAVQLLTGKGDGIRGSRSSWHRVAPSWLPVGSQYSAERLMAQKPLAN